MEVIANKVFDLKSNPNERVYYADIKDCLLDKCKDIEPDESWQSYLKIVDGGYEATVWMARNPFRQSLQLCQLPQGKV